MYTFYNTLGIVGNSFFGYLYDYGGVVLVYYVSAVVLVFSLAFFYVYQGRYVHILSYYLHKVCMIVWCYDVMMIWWYDVCTYTTIYIKYVWWYDDMIRYDMIYDVSFSSIINVFIF